MKDFFKAVGLISLVSAIHVIYFLTPATPPQILKFIHVETVPALSYGSLRGTPCVENRSGSADCFLVVEK